jgi:hypothetical protein
MKRVILIFFFFLFVKNSFACQCPITQLNTFELNKYEIIFSGQINQIKMNGTNSEAIFTIKELYKGMIAQNFKVVFNNEDACKLELRKGDDWIIYSNYNQIDNAKLDFCSRSRLYIKNITEDFFAVNTGISYDEELKYLQTNLGLHKLLKNNPNKIENRNKLPTGNQFIFILLCSVAGLVFFIWLVGKILKK